MITDKEILDAGYLSTGKKDVNGVTIFEGSIIGADGYNSDLEKKYFHCVEYDPDNQEFTSDIYGDSDSLSMYNEIKVFGHVLEYTDKPLPATKFYDKLDQKYHSVGEEKLSDLMWEFIKLKNLRYEWDTFFDKNNK